MPEKADPVGVLRDNERPMPCPACHHHEHDPGSCPECPRCELHIDEALIWLSRVAREDYDEFVEGIEREAIVGVANDLIRKLNQPLRDHGLAGFEIEDLFRAALSGEAPDRDGEQRPPHEAPTTREGREDMTTLKAKLAAASVLGTRPGFDWTSGPFTEADDEDLARLLMLLGWNKTEHDPEKHRVATGTLRRSLNQMVNLATETRLAILAGTEEPT